MAVAAGLVAFGMIGFVTYALVAKPPASNSRSEAGIRLPGLGQILGVERACGPGVYPPGASYRFERCTGSAPVVWPACSRVTYSVDGSHAPAGYMADVQEAVTQLEAATGLRLVPVSSRPNVSIAWDPALYDPQPGTSGEAGVTIFRSSGPHATSAAVRISAHLAAGATPQIGGEEPIPPADELGHAVGLAHFDGSVVMNPTDRGYARYQPGDLAGLRRLYHPATCQ